MSFHVSEQVLRITEGPLRSTDADGPNVAFWLRTSTGMLGIIASDGEGWEHVSVSRRDRVPTWSEMCQVKDAFWDEEDAVMQLHPPKSQWVNNHQFCLHLWRPVDQKIPMPPRGLV